MTKPIAIRKTASPEDCARIVAAIAEEKRFAEETKAQCREVAAEVKAKREPMPRD